MPSISEGGDGLKLERTEFTKKANVRGGLLFSNLNWFAGERAVAFVRFKRNPTPTDLPRCPRMYSFFEATTLAFAWRLADFGFGPNLAEGFDPPIRCLFCSRASNV